MKGNEEIELPSDKNAKAQRAVWIFRLSKVGVDRKKKTLANCTRLAGCTAEETAPGQSMLYMRCSRMSKNMDKAEQAEWEAHVRAALSSMTEGTEQDTRPGTGKSMPLAPVESIDFISYDNAEISPVSFAVVSLASIDEHSSATTTSTTILTQTLKGATHQSVSRLTTSASSQKSSKEAHGARQDEKELDNFYKSAFKVGTTLYYSVKSGENRLIKFSSVDKVAFEINKMFGIELVSGYQLKEGVNRSQ
jgi:hypothetical protein